MPIESWLQTEFRANRDMTLQKSAEMRVTFETTIRLVRAVFGDTAFRPVKKDAVIGDGLIKVGVIEDGLIDVGGIQESQTLDAKP